MGWLAGWKKRIKFTIDHDDIDAALDWFPVRLHLFDGHISPTGFSDADSEWGDETNIYDGNTATYGYTLTYDHYIELTLDSAINLDTIRIYGALYNPAVGLLDLEVAIDLYYDADWHNIFDGTIAKSTWVEKTNSAGVKSVSKARIKSNNESYRTFVYEFEFMRDDVSCVFDEVGANSKKIALTKADGVTELYGEIEKWDETNEIAAIWESRDGWAISDSEDTSGWLYYDNTHADNDTYIGAKNSTPAQSVWDANFKGVYHMADGADTSSIYDSTSNSNDGTKKGAAEPAEASGKIANAQDFNGGDDYINLGGALVNCGADFTVSAWVNKTGTSKGQIYAQGSTTDAFPIVQFAIDANGYAEFYLRDDTPYDEYRDLKWETVIREAWHKVTAVRDGNTMRLYVDGEEKNTASYSQTDLTHNTGNIGRLQRSTISDYYADGLIDEVRISDSARNAAWDKAEYESERDHLLTWGVEEIFMPPLWNYYFRRRITC